MKSLKLKFLAFLGVIALLQSCDTDIAPGIYKNEHISADKHQLFNELNARLFKALRANKPLDVEAMMSKELLETDGNRRTIDLVSLNSPSASYTILDEYYIRNDSVLVEKPLTTTATDGTKYALRYFPTKGETYIAFIVPKTKGDKYLLTAVYYKYSYGWRLSNLNFKPYTVNGKNAAQLSLIAMDQFSKGYLVDAYLSMRMVNKCIQPSNFWHYPEAKGIMAFDDKINNIINGYTYPLVVDQVPTKPKIFEVSFQTDKEGTFPVIRYVSDINVNDTTALKKENDNIKKAIGKMFLGIDQGKKYIYFSAYNQLPKPHKTTLSFDMTDTLQTAKN